MVVVPACKAGPECAQFTARPVDMAAPWCSQLCSPGSSWLCSEPWLMFWVNWSCPSLQSCTLVLTGVFTWVFMTVFRTLVDDLSELIMSVFAELHLGAHRCVHLGLHDCVQNPGWCSEWTDHVRLCRAAPWCLQVCSPGSSWQCSEPWLMFWGCRAAPSCSQLCSPGSSWLCSEPWLMFWGNWSGLSLQSCTLVFMAGCVDKALPGCWQLFCSQGWAGCSPLLTDCTLCVFTTAVTGLYLRAFLKYLLQTQELLGPTSLGVSPSWGGVRRWLLCGKGNTC